MNNVVSVRESGVFDHRVVWRRLPDLQENLDEKSEDGWELVAVAPHGDGYLLFFKRPSDALPLAQEATR